MPNSGIRSKVFANSGTKIAHDAAKKNDQCRESEIKSSNRVKFTDTDAAIAAGYTLCRTCYPGANER